MAASQKTRLDLALELVEYGRRAGADQIQVSVNENTEFSVDIREGRIEKLLEADARGLSVKTIVDQRVATASSSDLSPDTLRALIDNSIKRARYANQDPFAGLPEYQKETDYPDLKIFDPSVPEMKPDEKIKLAEETERICLADSRVAKSHGSGFSTLHGWSCLANSEGFSGSYSRTAVSCGVYLQTGSGDHLFDEGWYDTSCSLKNLWKPEQIAEKAVHRATRLIGAEKVTSCRVPVVFEPVMTAGLLGFLLSCVSGDNIYMKNSFLADCLGEKIADGRVTIIDDGRVPGAPGSRPFDREGVPTRETTVIEKGILKNFLLDTYSAKKLNSLSTGNASGANNFFLQAGDMDARDIIKSVDKGLLLTGTIGFGLVPTTGDISRGAFGLWIENGELSHPVAEITISGNLGDMLQNIEMIGDDLTFRRSVSGPTIKISEMTVGGK